MDEAVNPPVRFQFESWGGAQEKISPNETYSLSLGLPFVQTEKPHGRKLAIVGSGPSLRHHLKALKKWRGDIWAINGTVKYLHDNGIESTLVSVDPGERHDISRVTQAKDALLATICDPVLFDYFKDRVQLFFISEHEQAPFVASGGCTTACRMPTLSLYMGYREIVFFGCEGSYSNETHVTPTSETRPSWLWRLVESLIAAAQKD